MCDNTGIIKSVEKYSNRKTNKPSYYSEPDHDVIMAVEQATSSLKEGNGQINPIHVKGHHDHKKQYHELSREAQMNVDVNRLATSVLEEFATYSELKHSRGKAAESIAATNSRITDYFRVVDP